ncbi:MAG: hypothetical protein RLZ16_969, partial [Bacteroidota bacterium]
SGITIILDMYLLCKFGEIIKHGRILFILLPFEGEKFANHISFLSTTMSNPPVYHLRNSPSLYLLG